MFEKNEPQSAMIEKCVNTLYSAIKEGKYDEGFEWSVLAKKAGNPELTRPQLYEVVNKVNKLMMQHDSKYLQSVHGVGKRIANPNEHSTIARKTARSSVKIYRKAGAIIASTNMDLLSPEEKNKILEDGNKFRTMQLFAEEAFKNKKLGKKNVPDALQLTYDMISLFTGNKK